MIDKEYIFDLKLEVKESDLPFNLICSTGIQSGNLNEVLGNFPRAMTRMLKEQNMTFDELLTTNIARELDKSNQESNELRIKLEQLRKGYIEIASAYHLLNHFDNAHRHNGENWLLCDAMTCIAHRDYLNKLGLTNK